MPEFIKGQQSFVALIVVIAVILIGGIIFFNNRDQGEVTDEAAQVGQLDKEIEDLEKRVEEAAPEEKEDLQKELSEKISEKAALEEDETEEPGEEAVADTEFPKQYTVAKGDHLWGIATSFYNDGYKWTVLAAENNVQNPDIILPGQNLTIPEPRDQTYTVIAGDTLWGISERFYGTGFKWTIIRDANPGAIGVLPNGNPLIVPGQVLKIP